MTDRAHLYRVITDNQGNVRNGMTLTITVYQPGTTTPIADTLYVDNSSGTTLANPFTVSNGVVDFYLTNAQRVDLKVDDGAQFSLYSNVDVLDVVTSSGGSLPQSCMLVQLSGTPGFVSGYVTAGGVSVPLVDVGNDWLVKVPISGQYPSTSNSVTVTFSPFPTVAGHTWVAYNGTVFMQLLDPLTGDQITALHGGDINITSGTAVSGNNWTVAQSIGSTFSLSTAGLLRNSAGPVVGWFEAQVHRLT